MSKFHRCQRISASASQGGRVAAIIFSMYVGINGMINHDIPMHIKSSWICSPPHLLPEQIRDGDSPALHQHEAAEDPPHFEDEGQVAAERVVGQIDP